MSSNVTAGTERSGGAADFIIRGGIVRTMNPAQPTAEAVAVRDGRIIFVGSERDAEAFRGARTRIEDLAGAALYPGFIDAHAHVGGLGKALRQVRLNGAQTLAEAVERVRRRAEEDATTGVPAGGVFDGTVTMRALDGAGNPTVLDVSSWLEGRGWDQNEWSGKGFPTWRDLEGVTDRPVALRRIDGHALWVNQAALMVADITAATPDPDGGKIVRDERGDPTGILIDNAMDLVVDRMPKPSMNELLERLRRAMREMAAAGLTGAMDAGVDAAGIEAFRALGNEGGFLARVDLFLSDDDDLLASWWARGPEIGTFDDCLSIRGVKIYSDGALGSRGAALLDDYSDDPGNRGLILTEYDRMLRLTRASLDAGFDVAIHAIGDRGNRMVLDVFEEALAGRTGSPRCRVEHVQVLSPEDLPRFARLGVLTSMQPIHATSDMPWAEERLGPQRVRLAYAWRSLLRSGARIALGSDFPIEDHRPLLGIYAAVTRRDLQWEPEEGWYPEECLTLEEAVRGFTVDAAEAVGAGAMRGSIETGKYADLVVLSHDLFAIPPQQIPFTEVVRTIMNGRVVYDRL